MFVNVWIARNVGTRFNSSYVCVVERKKVICLHKIAVATTYITSWMAHGTQNAKLLRLRICNTLESIHSQCTVNFTNKLNPAYRIWLHQTYNISMAMIIMNEMQKCYWWWYTVSKTYAHMDITDVDMMARVSKAYKNHWNIDRQRLFCTYGKTQNTCTQTKQEKCVHKSNKWWAINKENILIHFNITNISITL